MKHFLRLLFLMLLVAIALPTVAPTQAQCTPRADWSVYTVARGDTLFQIAQRFRTTVADLSAGNCLTTTRISAGQRLRVPGPATPTAAPTVPVENPNGTFQTSATFLLFENGFMVWRADNGTIFVFSLDSRVRSVPLAAYGNLGLPEMNMTLQGGFVPNNGFGRVWRNNPDIREALGVATEANDTAYTLLIQQPSFGPYYTMTLPDGHMVRVNLDGTWQGVVATMTPTMSGQTGRTTGATFQPFENGFMVWRADTGEIRVYVGGERGTLTVLSAAQYGGLPTPSGVTAPAGRLVPGNGFGRVWASADTRSRLGFATGSEIGYTMALIESGGALAGFGLPDGRAIYDTQRDSTWVVGGNIYQPTPTPMVTPTATPVTPSPTAPAPTENSFNVGATYQEYEGGFMIWRADNNSISAFDQRTGRLLVFESAQYGNLPIDTTTAVPQGRVRPINGFGRVWWNYNTVWSAIGWPFAPEVGYQALVTTDAGGVVKSITLPEGGSVLTNVQGNIWSVFGPPTGPGQNAAEVTATPDDPAAANPTIAVILVTPGTRVPNVAAEPVFANPAQFQCFEGGFMILHEATLAVYTMIQGNVGSVALIVPPEVYANEDDPPFTTSPDPALLIPTGPFGKVYRLLAASGLGAVMGLGTTPVQRYELVITQSDTTSQQVSIPNGGSVDMSLTEQVWMWSYTDGNNTTQCPGL